MKKFLIGIVAAMAIFALAAPAPAIMKITSQGYFQVSGMYISGNPIDNNSRSNDWYNMEMIVTPVLHINDKVRLHSQVRVLERNYTGASFAAADGNLYATDAAQKKYEIFGNEQNDFWVERLYLAMEMWGGTWLIGRMSGGAFGYAFSDNETNADRIRYTRRFGIVTIGGVYEKSSENDGGLQAPRLSNMATDPSWGAADNDVDSYGLFAVVPLGKIGLLRELWWATRYGNPKNAVAATTDHQPVWRHLIFTELGFNFGMLKIDTEILYGFLNAKDVQLATKKDDVDYHQWAVWGEVGITPGPFELYGGGWWIEGEDSQNANNNDRVGAYWNVGRNYEPNLLLYSEDMGMLYGSGGTANGSIGSSGLRELHVRGSYKLTDAMKLRAQWDYSWWDQMEYTHVDTAIGWEADAGFEWKFMPNVTYIIEGAYFSPSDFFKDYYNNDDSVYGFRHTIRVEW